MKKLLMTLALAAAFPVVVQAADDPLRIGVLNDQSGLYSDFGGITSVTAAQMAVDDFGGEVLGRKIEVLSADHQNKTDVATSTARKWFDLDHVEMVADLTNSAVALAVQGLAAEKGKITIASGPFSAALTGKACTPTGFHWAFDTYASAVGTATGLVQEGEKTWFILAADYAYGKQLAADLTHIVERNGGEVVGDVYHPVAAPDFASFLLQAQSSHAQAVALANAGADTINSIKQAAEFGITQGGQKLVALGIVISDVHALGLDKAQGLVATTPFYWDRNDASREFSKRFEQKTGRMPGMVQAAVYSSTLHYLKAVKAAGTADSKVVAQKMRELPVHDFFAQDGVVRPDGWMAHEMFLIQVKSPEESKGPWDYYKILRTLPASLVSVPASESECPLMKP
ncbi:ABC transporter substrate-binding protein [Castellaniella sp.]|uniref:ABC transporter substrate-binding protein n=1 Tax=Castellaniella sp. TaxID=1955812 RepID=UPI0035659066